MDVQTQHQKVTEFCPVCGTRMEPIVCVDDLIRPYCSSCMRTYTPIGYTDDLGYGTRWTVTDQSTEESITLNTKKAEV